MALVPPEGRNIETTGLEAENAPVMVLAKMLFLTSMPVKVVPVLVMVKAELRLTELAPTKAPER
jgi:hypothetical protein